MADPIVHKNEGDDSSTVLFDAATVDSMVDSETVTVRERELPRFITIAEGEKQPDEIATKQSSPHTHQNSTKAKSNTCRNKSFHEANWQKNFRELCAYKEKHGHLNIPVKQKGLGSFITNQRRNYKKYMENKPSTMTATKVKALESLGFSWRSYWTVSTNKSFHEANWQKNFRELSAHKEKHGHLNITVKQKGLGSFITNQRRNYKKYMENKPSTMTAAKVEALESLGFQWVDCHKISLQNLNEECWQTKFLELCAYKEEHGDVNVPSRHVSLGSWITTQRRNYKLHQRNEPSSLTPARIQALESLGFHWCFSDKTKTNKNNDSIMSFHDISWHKKFRELSAYKEEHGHLNIPVRRKGLGSFITNQRRNYITYMQNKPSTMTAAKVEALESIGFKWRLIEGWNARFSELLKYKEKHGNMDIPNSSEDLKSLASWVRYQRTQYKQMKQNKHSELTPERIQMLNSINFQWTTKNMKGNE